MSVSITAEHWSAHKPTPPPFLRSCDRLAASAAMVVIGALAMASSVEGDSEASSAAPPAHTSTPDWLQNGNETVASAYAGAPFYYRSDLHLTRPNGTDMTLKRMGWDGDALYFPIDGGARVVRWSGSMGVMVDFLHNKAVARLGTGAHGRKIKNGVIEDVETTGTLKGQPAPSPLRLTNLLERLEFTHGHNVLMLTGLARLGPVTPKIRPYVGIGFGVAVPHVEVRFAGETSDRWTNEYQYAGPALQFLAGFELRLGRGSYFIEYKFIWSSLSAALTGGRSWSLKDLNSPWLPRWLVEPFAGLTEMPGDLYRQFARWKSGEAPAEGSFVTHLTSHQVVAGAGYVWPGGVPAGPAGTQP